MAEMSEDELLGILEAEKDDAVGYYDSDIAHEQEDALRYYFGRPFGDEVEGRSSVVSRDVAETVDWLMPDLMRIFTQGEMRLGFTGRLESLTKIAMIRSRYWKIVESTNPLN